MKNILTIKFGGSVLDDVNSAAKIADDMAELYKQTGPMVVVHGGGKSINAMLARCGLKASFQDGLRVTDDETMAITEMVLSGKINADIVALLRARSVPAVGLSGRGADLFRARQRPELGRVGEVTSVDTLPLLALFDKGYLPVVSPVGSSESGAALNINADEAASALAVAMASPHFLYLTDVAGVKIDGQVRTSITLAEGEKLLVHPDVQGGMLPKLRCALAALRGGVGRVSMINASEKNCLLRAARGEEIGTVLVPG